MAERVAAAGEVAADVLRAAGWWPRLRAALEEEKQALLAQSEALRLSIEDEHDYRGRVAQPPSLTSLLELKRSLQDILAKTPDVVLPHSEGAPVGGADPPAAARGRSSLCSMRRCPGCLERRHRLQSCRTSSHCCMVA